MDKANAKRVARYILLGVVAVAVVAVYGRVLFPSLTFLLEYSLGAKFYWDKAPVWRSFFGTGVGLLAAIVVTVGVNNLLFRRAFFDGINWLKLLIVVFCSSMLYVLFEEADDLIPKYAFVEEHNEEEGNPLHTMALVIVALVGYAMWPKKPPEPETPYLWRCSSCGNFNLTTHERCLNPRCGEKGSPEEILGLFEGRIHEAKQDSEEDWDY